MVLELIHPPDFYTIPNQIDVVLLYGLVLTTGTRGQAHHVPHIPTYSLVSAPLPGHTQNRLGGVQVLYKQVLLNSGPPPPPKLAK